MRKEFENNFMFSNITGISVKIGRCDITIAPSEDDNCYVTVDGSCLNFDDFIISKCGNQLNIEVLVEGPRMSLNVNIKDLKKLHLEDTRDNRIYVTVAVPYVEINSKGSSVFKIESISDGNVVLSGSSEIVFKNVSHSLSSLIAGSGNIKVCQGALNQIDVIVSGSGSFKSNAAVKEANVVVTGSGRVILSSVTDNLMQNCTGTGNIQIEKNTQGKE